MKFKVPLAQAVRETGAMVKLGSLDQRLQVRHAVEAQQHSAI